MKKNSLGFGLVGILLLLVTIGIVFTAGWLVLNKQSKLANNSEASSQSKASPEATQVTNYFILKEWGVKFAIPKELTDVEYVINGNLATFYGKAAGYQLEYRSDYKETLRVPSYPKYGLGRLYQRDEAKSDLNDQAGRKIGEYYYYTAHSFSALSSGKSGFSGGLYFDSKCDIDSNSSSTCQMYIQAEEKAFQLFNDQGGFLRSIAAAN